MRPSAKKPGPATDYGENLTRQRVGPLVIAVSGVSALPVRSVEIQKFFNSILDVCAPRYSLARPDVSTPFWGLAVRARVCRSEPLATFEVGATLHRACIAGPAFRGTCPTQALEAQGAIGSSRKVGPVRPLYTADRLMDALRDTGCRFRRSRTPSLSCVHTQAIGRQDIDLIY